MFFLVGYSLLGNLWQQREVSPCDSKWAFFIRKGWKHLPSSPLKTPPVSNQKGKLVKSQMESPEEVHGDTRIPLKNQHEIKFPLKNVVGSTNNFNGAPPHVQRASAGEDPSSQNVPWRRGEWWDSVRWFADAWYFDICFQASVIIQRKSWDMKLIIWVGMWVFLTTSLSIWIVGKMSRVFSLGSPKTRFLLVFFPCMYQILGAWPATLQHRSEPPVDFF